MDKMTHYYIKKINEAIQNNNKTDANMYYEKAISNIGESPEITELKSKVNSLEEPFNEKHNEDNTKDQTTKKNNETKISLIAVGVATIILISYLSIFVFPKHNLKKKLVNEEWYQGDVSTYTSDGVILEFNSDNNYDFKIVYRLNKRPTIAEFKGKVLNGHEISVDGRTINVHFEDSGEKVVFSPSFVDLSEESVWKKYSIFHENEPFYVSESSKNVSITSNKTDTYNSNISDFSSNTVNEPEYDTFSETYDKTNDLTSSKNNSGTSSKYNSSSTVSSHPSNANTQTSKSSNSSIISSVDQPTVSGTVNGFSYTTRDDGTIEIEKYEGNETSVNVPSEINGRAVTSIGYGAFSKCNSMVNITLPNSIKSIGLYAFEYCRNLTSITLSNGITSIGGGAFDTCEKLSSITIPKSVKTIGSNAFVYCHSLDVINYSGTMSQWNSINNVDSIGGYSTIHCTDGDIS